MSANRIDTLKSFVARNPNDPFSHYGLAMEYVRQDRLDEALGVFAQLLERHPDYVPTYFQAGMVFAKAGNKVEAQAVLSKGIEVAERLGNIHAKNELQEALTQIAIGS
ncbi:MAG TPA: tetratricopeptide repeat protein [Acidobacteriota bacterium]|jgi:tetratricopeptide (TPR) repeat protein